MHQVVTIGADGSIQGLQVKPGKGMDLRQFGRAAIVRASEILFDDEQQAWTIRVMDRAVIRHMGHPVMKLRAYDAATGKGYPRVPHAVVDGILFFGEYEDAVAVEIEALDALRAAGIYDRP